MRSKAPGGRPSSRSAVVTGMRSTAAGRCGVTVLAWAPRPSLYALLVSDFLDTVGNVLQLTVVLLGPSTAVYATDIVLRRNRYDGIALGDESRTGPFWYTGGFNWAGVLALASGVAVSALCVDTVYTGPVAAALGGVDLALPTGLVVSSAAYALLTRRIHVTA
ncbi:hypothetical protein AQI95_15000 [Streptomyces yokosukanensis]|uniref:Uncharacterized protein n=1 Tax=Streptomyces yokosukanensis TaxID=67386 RepID=A0A101P786_9ACTN|nr:hypothetical protein AQI95_15000 [Streptomyces yokosukanensis]